MPDDEGRAGGEANEPSVYPTSPLRGGLQGYRILDLTDGRGALCTKLLSDFGAQVVKIEPPSGDPTRRQGPFVGDVPNPEKSLPFLFLNTNKRSVTLNLDHATGRRVLMHLLPEAHAVVETLPPGTLASWGMDFSAMTSRNPRLVLTSISGFGQSGPHRDFAWNDLIAVAMGGLMNLCGDPGAMPLKPGGTQGVNIASLYAAVGTLFGLRAAEHSGRGVHVDLSAQEAVASIIPEFGILQYREQGVPPTRFGHRRPDAYPNGIYPCQDGLFYIIVLDWVPFAEWVATVTERVEILDPKYEESHHARLDDRALLDEIITAFTQCFTKAELFHEGQRRRHLFAPVSTPAEIIQSPQLAAHGFFVEVDHPIAGPLTYPGAPFNAARLPWQSGHAPLLGEHNEVIFGGELGLSNGELQVLARDGVI